MFYNRKINSSRIKTRVNYSAAAESTISIAIIQPQTIRADQTQE